MKANSILYMAPLIEILITENCQIMDHAKQARRVDSVEGGSFMFWEVFFSARGASL